MKKLGYNIKSTERQKKKMRVKQNITSVNLQRNTSETEGKKTEKRFNYCEAE